MTELGIVIVNYNVSDKLKNCLESLNGLNHKDKYKIIIVDNNSSDNSVSLIKKEFPDIFLIENKENLGFAKANNIAIDFLIKTFSSIEYILLLNPDVVVSYNTIDGLLEFLKNNHNIGCVSPALYSEDNNVKNNCGGFIPGLFTSFNYFFFLSQIMPRLFKGIFINQEYFIKRKKPIELDWLSGACLMLRKNMILEVGLLNEIYFLYGEDIEWGNRIKKGGWTLYLIPELRVVHLERESLRKLNTNKVLWLDGFFQYLKMSNKSTYASIRFFAVIGFLLRLIIYKLIFMFKKSDYFFNRSTEMKTYFKYSLLEKW